MIETPSNGRAKIRKAGNGIEVQIPSRKNWFIIAFLCFWLCGWFFGEVFAISILFIGDLPIFSDEFFLLIWLAGWTIGGLFCITILLWSLVGQEIIKAENGVLEIGREIFSFKKSKKYHLKDVRHLTINPVSHHDFWPMGFQTNLFGLKGGVLKFDYGMKTLRFADGIDEAEGRLLLETFKVNSNFVTQNFA